jgi:hypothetical protein
VILVPESGVLLKMPALLGVLCSGMARATSDKAFAAINDLRNPGRAGSSFAKGLSLDHSRGRSFP